MISKLKTWLVVAGASILAIVAAVAYGYAEGRKIQKDAEAKNTLKRASKVKEVRNEIDGLGSRAIDERLSRWMRD